MSSISVYGGTGFIGSSFSRLSHNKIDVVDRSDPNPRFSNVLYAIGTTDNYNIFQNPTLDIEVNLIKLIETLDSLKFKFSDISFNYLSSWFVYGEGSKLPLKESYECRPKGFYSISKFSAEMFIRSYCETYGIKYRIFRLANVFGNTDRGISKKKNALQYLINEIKQGKDIDLYEGGDFVRDYIDIRDVVSALDIAIESAPLNSVLNVGTGIPSRFIDLLERAKSDFRSKSQFNFIPTPDFHRKVQIRDAYLDTTALKNIGFNHKYNILDEIKNL